MRDHDFLFALELPGEPRDDTMIADLIAAVLGYAGYDAASIGAVTREVGAVLGGGALWGRERCELRFRASGGELQLSIARAGRAAWRMTRALPAGS